MTLAFIDRSCTACSGNGCLLCGSTGLAGSCETAPVVAFPVPTPWANRLCAWRRLKRLTARDVHALAPRLTASAISELEHGFREPTQAQAEAISRTMRQFPPYALSVRQPWAAAMLYLDAPKDVENRTWALPPGKVKETLLLHAGKAQLRPGEWSGPLFEHAAKARPLDFGGIIGTIRFYPTSDTPCTSPWAEPGCKHWRIAEARPLPFQPYQGRLGFFPVPVETLSDAICATLAGASSTEP